MQSALIIDFLSDGSKIHATIQILHMTQILQNIWAIFLLSEDSIYDQGTKGKVWNLRIGPIDLLVLSNITLKCLIRSLVCCQGIFVNAFDGNFDYLFHH